MGSDDFHGEGEDGANGKREQRRRVNLVGDDLVISCCNRGVKSRSEFHERMMERSAG